MNKSKFKKYLTKINSFETWIDNDEELSQIELDLLSDYIKKLYESIIEKKHNKPAEKTPEPKKIIKNKEEPQKTVEEKTEDVETKDIKEKPVGLDTSTDKPIKKTEDKPKHKEYSAEFLSIFSDNGANELSAKLSLRLLSNLKKAFGINEKIFTINELFDGNKSEFNSAIEKLNDFTDFEDAKSYILEYLAPVFDWDKSKKIKKVDQFVKTIKRRYIK